MCCRPDSAEAGYLVGWVRSASRRTICCSRGDGYACTGRGLCAEALPELITFDDYGSLPCTETRTATTDQASAGSSHDAHLPRPAQATPGILTFSIAGSSAGGVLAPGQRLG